MMARTKIFREVGATNNALAYKMCDKNSRKQTNADRIRSMSDEDIPCKICEYWSKEISSCNATFGFMCTKEYAEALYLKWLKSEAERN